MIEEIRGDFIQWLRGFYHVAKTNSATKAGITIGRSQPTVSHHIKSLEKEFGVSLFERSPDKKMDLTAQGRALLDETIVLFDHITQMKRAIQETELEQEGTVTIVSSHAIASMFLPQYIKTFRQTHKRVRLIVHSGNREVILEKIEAAEADFGIASVGILPSSIAYHHLFETQPKLIAPKGFFGPGKLPTLKQISQVPFILFTPSATETPYIDSNFIDSFFKPSQFTPDVVLITNNFHTVKRYVGQGLGVSILDAYTLSEHDREDLDVFSLEQLHGKRVYGLILRKRKQFSPAAKAFISLLKPDIDFTSRKGAG